MPDRSLAVLDVDQISDDAVFSTVRETVYIYLLVERGSTSSVLEEGN